MHKYRHKPVNECTENDIIDLDKVEFVVGHENSMALDEVACAKPLHITPCVFSPNVSGTFSLLVVASAPFTLHRANNTGDTA